VRTRSAISAFSASLIGFTGAVVDEAAAALPGAALCAKSTDPKKLVNKTTTGKQNFEARIGTSKTPKTSYGMRLQTSVSS
jgi:hypothetical protein